MHVVAIVQARMTSSRLPGKVLMPLGGVPVLSWCVRAALSIPGVDNVVVATSDDASDDVIAQWCEEQGGNCVRGPLGDVLTRYAMAARQAQATHVLRLTADCPLLDAQVCGAVLAMMLRGGYDYVSNCVPRQWPDGLDCEAFTAEALFTAEKEARDPQQREHVTPFIRNHQHRFRVGMLPCPLPGLHAERWTLDTPADMEFLQALVPYLPYGRTPTYLDVLAAIAGSGAQQAQPAPASALAQLGPEPSFAVSKALLAEAEQYIPHGSQTFSKSSKQFPVGHAPLFVTHGEGGRVWDVDGNGYVDLVCGLLPLVLGYADADVDAAIREQLAHGITFSLPTVLETELARRMHDMIPCAEKVRFAKNGSDVTAGAIRVARAFTGRERVMVCGYHGWQDWYIGATTRHKGVPEAVRGLTHSVAYNDVAAIEKMLQAHPGEFAALIMEPVNAVLPHEGYFDDVKQLLHQHGTLLVFDEVITGFRLHKGGAQGYFGVTPDLGCFGKAMGNGMPISALAGRADVMAEMDHIFFSGTFGGEALSLAAAIAVLDKIQREPVIETLWQTGDALRGGVMQLLKKYGMEQVVVMKGMAPWVLLDFLPQPTASREAIKTLFVTQMAKRGVLILGSHNVCYAHSKADVAQVLAAYDGTLAHIAAELASGGLEAHLPFAPIYPAFTVR
ncbi:MAG: aminotransferase class III-fold pyridoxal phosphate-dependent enzyme [Proteobacteria bacterium]|nr:aminotransferase class III-fold pyridoxal phosphate-dependent enzyme [Pseudomonadota bacterium]